MYQIIVNPTSSSGKGMEAWEKIKAILNRRSVTYKVHMLQDAGEATQVVRELTAQDEAGIVKLLVIGGDGTLNEVLNGRGEIPIEDAEKDFKISSKKINDIIKKVFKNKAIEVLM